MVKREKGSRSLVSDPYEIKEPWATVQMIAELYSMHPESVRRKVRDGTWPSHRQGRTIRFSPKDQRQIDAMWQPTTRKRLRSGEIQELVHALA